MSQLDQNIANRMYERAIADLDLSGYQVESNKRLILLGGQPASGKSSVIDAISQANNHNMVVLNSDDYKEFYPNANFLLKTDPNKVAEIHQYSNHVLGRVMSTVADRGYNILLEGTMRNPEYQLSVVERAKSMGYQVEAYIISCNEYSSKVGIIERYELENSQRGFGRFVPQEFHNDAYKNPPETLDKLVNSHKLDNIAIITRNGGVIGETANGDDVVKIYTTHRQQMTPNMYNDINARIKDTENMIAIRDPRSQNLLDLQSIRKDLNNYYQQQNSITTEKNLFIDRQTKVNDVLSFFEKHAPETVNQIRADNSIQYGEHKYSLEHMPAKFLADHIKDSLGKNGADIQVTMAKELSRGIER